MSVFKKLQEDHETLLAKQAKNEFDVDVLDEAKEYVRHVRQASSQVYSPEEREYLRANLRFWSSYIYEQTDVYPNIDLAPPPPQTIAIYIRQNWFYLAIMGLLITIILLLTFSESLQTSLANFASSNAKRIAFSLTGQASEIVFAGQVEDDDGRWLNNYVIVLFQNGEEIVRTTSRLSDSTLSGNGPMDGVFELRIPNVYGINLKDEFTYSDGSLITMNLAKSLNGTQSLGRWFSELNPNDIRVIMVPEKQLEFAIVVLPYPQEILPESYGRGRVILDGTRLVINSDSPTVQFTILPSRNNGLDWNLQMTGYSGDRWDVWERFVEGRIPGLDWETFSYSVLVHNPHLETDSFIFYPEKSYLLPSNQ